MLNDGPEVVYMEDVGQWQIVGKGGAKAKINPWVPGGGGDRYVMPNRGHGSRVGVGVCTLYSLVMP